MRPTNNFKKLHLALSNILVNIADLDEIRYREGRTKLLNSTMR